MPSSGGEGPQPSVRGISASSWHPAWCWQCSCLPPGMISPQHTHTHISACYQLFLHHPPKQLQPFILAACPPLPPPSGVRLQAHVPKQTHRSQTVAADVPQALSHRLVCRSHLQRGTDSTEVPPPWQSYRAG